MRRLFSVIILSVMAVILPACGYAEPQPSVAPFSQAYMEWLAQQNEPSVPDNKSAPGQEEHANTYIPFHIDMSHLADNPPIDPYPNYRAGSANDSSYDLRKYGKTTKVKDQNPYGTCWAHAAIGAMESNYLVQSKDKLLGDGNELDLSEMHLVYFSFINPTKSKAFHNTTSINSALDNGGNAFYPTALYSRLDGPILEDNINIPYGNTTPKKNTPESYTRVLRLKDVFYLAMQTRSNASTTANLVNSNKAVIKQRIVENGGVMASYHDATSNYQKTETGGTACYVTTTSTNHAVLLVGWDDNYSRNNFKSKPKSDGAWLVKNSWGNTWGDDGYFWMSYESYMTDGTAFVVDDVDDDLEVYYYDALGWTSSWGYSSEMTAANVFKATRDDEVLSEIGIYTPDNNVTCVINIYTGLGTSMPSSPVSSGGPDLTQTVTIPYAGYHTIELEDTVALTNGEYFSVSVTYKGQGIIPVEMKSTMSPNASIEAGSFFSYAGGWGWISGTSQNVNATIKAFTTIDAGDTPPSISTTSLPDGTKSTKYSAKLRAKGKKPIVWLLKGDLPAGLSLSSKDGTISGTPSAEGTSTFTVIASNDLGSADKSLSITITNLPVITTKEITGYAGYALNTQFALNTGASATWGCGDLASNKNLKGLKLSTSGTLTGKPKKAGTYYLNVTADTDAGTSTATVTLIVQEKPVKAAIKTSKLTQINIGESVNDALEYTGTEPVTFEVIGLPDGVYFDESTATFSGTPSKTGTFVIEVTISNIVNELTGKEAKPKKLKLVVKAKPPVIAAPESLPDGEVNVAYSETITISQGSEPEKWSASGLPKGLTMNKDTGVISGKPEKAGTFNVTIQAQNNGGKDKTGKIPLVIYAKPEITVKKLNNGTTGKAYSAKLTATGTPTTWIVENLPDGLSASEDKKGNKVIAGIPTTPGKSSVRLIARNKTGSDDKTFDLTIKGVAPKIKPTFPKGTVGSEYSAKIEVTGTLPLTELKYEIAAADLAKAGISSLEELGLTFVPSFDDGIALIKGTPKYSVKGLAVQIIASNAEKKDVKKKASLKIAGTKPAFTTPSGKDYKSTLSSGTAVNIPLVCTGSEKLTWSMKDVSGFKLTQDASEPHKAALTGTMPSSGKVSTTITVANADGKASMKVTLELPAKASSVEDNAELTTEHEEEELELEESGLRIGAERSAGDIGQAEQEAIAREGYTVIAVLPEIRADSDGMYDFDVELIEDAEVGRSMVWLAFPQDAEASEDDGIAEFFDENGAEISAVPSSRKVKVSVWLREGVTYAPVIAVK
ncbi:MAG: putative Ig domain-containing protein [Synergistaceae bacterium]|nr:putative Ig domain-containing protein [Synergistaceae bacterium]